MGTYGRIEEKLSICFNDKNVCKITEHIELS
jgi:hypothetical protein